MVKSVKQLAKHFQPHNYALSLDLSQSARRDFAGEVTITGTLVKPTNSISLHSKDLTVTHAAIDGHPAQVEYAQNDELRVKSQQPLVAGEHTITLSYQGKITDAMHGIYPCYFTHQGQQKELIATQFESHHAREAFPCIDEPAAKAVFTVTLSTQTGITVLGNTPVASQNTADGVLTTVFESTPRMSTYLVAFVCGELGYTQATTKYGVTVRSYATPDKIAQTRYATDLAAQTLDFYNDYFEIPYPLPKCDMVALPDFSSGAMENWGLITYRESSMLFDPQNTAADTKQYISSTITHELAHQWFGNLVTMEWWDDLWLNESFASWMADFAIDHFYPQWQTWEQFGASEYQYAFTRDGLASVQAVQQQVHHPDEIQSQFDSAIVYAKGACLLRMLHEYIGADAFRQGLRTYMKRHKYQNTVTNDLWQALSEASGKDVATFMQPWLAQPGHPVVSVTQKNANIELRQQRFYAHPYTQHDTKTLWPVPLLSEATAQSVLATPQSNDYLANKLPLINKNGTGFYHVRYDDQSLQTIVNAIPTGQLSALDRQRLLFDSIALAKAGTQPTTATLTLMAAYKNESVYSVWLAISAAFGAIKTLVNNDPSVKPDLQRYVATLTKKESTRLGWERQKNEPYFDELLRPIAIGSQAYAETPDVTAHALKLFDAAKQPEDLLAELRSIIYTVAIKERGQTAYERLLDWYKNTPSAEERINLCAGITAARDKNIIAQALSLITTQTIRNQDVIFWIIHFMRSPYGRDLTWQWMVQNWQWIYNTFNSDMDYVYFPRFAAAGSSTMAHLAQYKDFFTPKQHEPALTRTITQGIEDIEIRALWRERDLPAIAEFLKNF